MKINGKSVAVTCGLLFMALIAIFIEIAIFISGPARKFEDKVDHQIAKIKESYARIEDVQRHVFHYVVYIGEDSDMYVWFNEKGKAIASRKKTSYQKAAVNALIEKNYQGKVSKVSLGYGYKNPVYVVNFDKGEVLLDYDTLDEVYYLKKGE